MQQFTVTEKSGKDIFYLNHAYLSLLSFGSYDMAWTGSHEQATAYLKQCRSRFKGQYRRFSIQETV